MVRYPLLPWGWNYVDINYHLPPLIWFTRLADIGLRKYNDRLALFGNLLPPTLCIVTAVIQNSYLHHLFLVYSSLKGSKYFVELQRKYGYDTPNNNNEIPQPNLGEISIGEPFRGKT